MNPTGGTFPSGLTSILPIATPPVPKSKTTIPPPLKATAITPNTSVQPLAAKGKPKTERKRKAPEDKEKKPRAPKPPADPNAPKKPKKIKQPGEGPTKPRKPKDGAQSPSFFDDLEEFSKEDGALDEEEAPPKEEEEDEDENLFEDDDVSTPDKARVSELLSQFSPDQQSRYEYYRRSSLPRSSVKKLMQQVSGGAPVNGKMAVVMSGISKIFVGEIVETARTVMEEWKETGSLKPRHIREAYRRLKQAGKIPYEKPDAKLFKRVY